MSARRLLAILELGGYPNFVPLYNRLGFDVDLARGLATAMRVELDIKVLPFGDLMKALDKGEIDMIISNMSITPEAAGTMYMPAGPLNMISLRCFLPLSKSSSV